MRSFAVTLESFLAVVLLLSGAILGLYGLFSSQILLGILGLVVYVMGFGSMMYVYVTHPESRNEAREESHWNKLERAFYSWESLP